VLCAVNGRSNVSRDASCTIRFVQATNICLTGDEGRPGCRRCAQIRKTCPGYPFQIQLDLRIPPQPTTAAAVVKHESSSSVPPDVQPRVSTAEPQPSLTRDHRPKRDRRIKSEDSGELISLYHAPEYAPRSPPKYDVQHQSVCYFVHLFCFQAGRLYSFPVLDFLPDILQHAEPKSAVHLAATAVSRMTLADQYSGQDVRLQTGREYGDALAVTMKAIRDPAQNILDDTVVAVWLLGLYEAVNAVLVHGRTKTQDMKPEDEYRTHMNLLKLRGSAQFTTARGEKIFRVLKAAIQMRLFNLNSVTSRDFGDLELDIYQDEHEFVPSKTANKASAFFLQVARLTETIKNFLFGNRDPDNNDYISLETKRLVKYGEALDHNMDGWATTEPGWALLNVRGDSKGTAWAIYPSQALYYFYSFWVFLYWIRFLIARVKLYEALIELVSYDPDVCGPDAAKSDIIVADHRIAGYKTIIQSTATEIIGLTAYALGDVANTGDFNSAMSGRNPGRTFQEINVIAAMQLVIPLKALQRSPYPSIDQKGAIDLAISHIGDGFRRQPLRLV
jgi:hypothetical protein